MTAAPLRIGIVCYPTYGGSGVVATELGKALADQGHEVHFITYTQPVRLGSFRPRVFYHEVEVSKYPLFDYLVSQFPSVGSSSPSSGQPLRSQSTKV